MKHSSQDTCQEWRIEAEQMIPYNQRKSQLQEIIRAPVKLVAKLRVNDILYLIDLCEGSREHLCQAVLPLLIL